MGDRDQRKPITPPKGVAAQIARPSGQASPFEELTPVDGDIGSQINVRAKNAAESSKAAFAQVTNLRNDFRAEVARNQDAHDSMNQSIQRLDIKVDKVSEHVGDLREKTGVISGQLTSIIKTLDQQQQAQHVRMVAELEVDKVGKLSEIEVRKAERLGTIEDSKEIIKFRRQRALKILGIAGTLATGVGGIIAALASNC